MAKGASESGAEAPAEATLRAGEARDARPGSEATLAAMDAWSARLAGDATVAAADATVGRVAPELDATAAAPAVARSFSTSAGRLVAGLPRIGVATTASAAGSDATASQDLRLLGVLGEGGMGVVYEAEQSSLGRRVAVKVVRGSAAADLAALLREARLTGALEHPGVVPVHALGLDDAGRPILVMKRLEGTSWQVLLDDPQHPAWEELGTLGQDRLGAHLEILTQVARTVAFAHARGIVHRDIKPANVVVGRFGEVYLVDWGIALDLARRDAEPPGPVGTPSYLAPEMVLGDARQIDERTDVFLLGATLHAILAGRPRHAGDNVRDVLRAALEVGPVTYPDEVPAELAVLANQATASAPADRPPTASAFAEALRAFVEHRGSLAVAERGAERLAEAQRAALEGSAGRVRARRLLVEARFAAEQALEAWPGHEGARDLLASALERSVRLELDDGAVGAARALLEAAPRPFPELEAACDRVEAERAEAALEGERLRREDEANRPTASAGLRTVLLAFLTLGIMAFAFGTRGARLHGDPYVTWRTPLFPVVVGGLFLPALWLGRRAIQASAFNRKLVAVVYAVMGLSVVHRINALVHRSTVVETLLGELVLLAALMAFLGVFTRRIFLAPFVLTLGCIAGGLLAPDLLEFFYSASPFAFVVVSLLAGRDGAPGAGTRASP